MCEISPEKKERLRKERLGANVCFKPRMEINMRQTGSRARVRA